MSIQQLRQSLKLKWVSYYYNNRSWLEKMRVWGTYDGLRRPSSGFILATLSVLEPQLEEIFPFILELNNDPDQIIAALGLNFNPEEQLHLLEFSTDAENQVDTDSLPQKSLSATVVVTEMEQSQPVSSVAVTTEVPFQTLSECKSTESATASEVESQSNSMPLMTMATTQMQSKSKSLPLVTLFSSEVTSKTQFVPVATATKMASNNSSNTKFVPVATATEVESKSQPRSLVAVIVREVESKAVQCVSLATRVENKSRLMTTLQKDAHNQVKPPPGSQSRHLANWIDNFCEGVGWDQEETTSSS